ncbi:hypothetical protein LCGC14_1665330 [marine sediment metagenome]|uniref:Uncharacterized protein n=1 Tax=marine sediment metagenome TaxID=412755 RepID=A0A0F9IFH2_9ZZZZ
MRQIVVSDDIMEKVSSREKNAVRLTRCLAVNICPECGKGINRVTFNDGGRAYDCTECNFSLTQ